MKEKNRATRTNFKKLLKRNITITDAFFKLKKKIYIEIAF